MSTKAPVDEVSRFASLYDQVSRPLKDLTLAGRATAKKSKYNIDARSLNPALVRERRTVRSEIGVDGASSVDTDAFLQRAVTRQRNRGIVALRNPGVEGEQPEMPGFRLEYMANVCALEEEDRVGGTVVANRILNSKSTVADALHRHGDNAMRRRNLEDNLAKWQVKINDSVAANRLETLAREEELDREVDETAASAMDVEVMTNTFKDSFDRLSHLNFFVEKVVSDAKHNMEVRGAFRRPTKTTGTGTDLSFFSGIKGPTTSTLDQSDDESPNDRRSMAGRDRPREGSVMMSSSMQASTAQGSPAAKSEKDKVAAILAGYEEKINELQERLGRRTEALINALKMVEAVEKQHKRNERTSERNLRSKDDEMLRLRMYIEALETGVGFTLRWEWRGEAGDDDESSATKFIAQAMQIAREEAKKEHQRALLAKSRDTLEASRRRDIINHVEHEDSAAQLRDQLGSIERSRDELREMLAASNEAIERQSETITKTEADLTMVRAKLLVTDSELSSTTKQLSALKERNEELETTLRDTLSEQQGTQLDAQELLDERDGEVERLRRTIDNLAQGSHVTSLEQDITDLQKAAKHQLRETLDLRERNATVKKLNMALESRIKALEGNETQLMETVCQVASTMLRELFEVRAVLSKKVPPLQLTSRPIYAGDAHDGGTPFSSRPQSPDGAVIRSNSSSGMEGGKVLVVDRKHASGVVRFHFVSQHRLWELTSTIAGQLDDLVRSVAAPLIQSPGEEDPHVDSGDGIRLPDTTAGRVLRDLKGAQRQATPAHLQQVETHLRVVVDDTPLALQAPLQAPAALVPVGCSTPPMELSLNAAPLVLDTSTESVASESALLPHWADDLVRLQAIVTKIRRLLALRFVDTREDGDKSSASNALWALRGMSAALATEVALPIYRLRQESEKPIEGTVEGPSGPINVDSHLHEVLAEIPAQVSRCLWRKVMETVRARRGLINKCRQAELRVATATSRLRDATYQTRHSTGSAPSHPGLGSVLSVAHVCVRSLVQSYISLFPCRTPGSRSRPTSARCGPTRMVTDALLSMGRTLEDIREAQATYGGSGGGAWLRWFDIDAELHPPYASMLMSSEDGRISALHRRRLRLISELQSIDDVDTRFLAKQQRRNQAVMEALKDCPTGTPSESPRPSASTSPRPSVLSNHVATSRQATGIETATSDPSAASGAPPLKRMSLSVDPLRDSARTHTASPSSDGDRSPPLGRSHSSNDQDPRETTSTVGLMERTTSFRTPGQPPQTQPVASDHPSITPAATVASHQLVAAVVREAVNQIASALRGGSKYHAPFDISKGAEVQAVIQRIQRASSGNFHIPSLQKADDALAQLFPAVLAAVAHNTPPPKPQPNITSVYTQCDIPPPIDSPWSRGRELAERIVSRNRPTSASSARSRPASASSLREDVYGEVVDTLVPTFVMGALPLRTTSTPEEAITAGAKSSSCDGNRVVYQLHSSTLGGTSPVMLGSSIQDNSEDQGGSAPTPPLEASRDVTPEVRQLTDENHILATHVQDLQRHIVEVKRNLKAFLQQAVTESIMRPLPDGTWARQDGLVFTEKDANDKPSIPIPQRYNLVVSDPMKFSLRREKSDDSGVVLRGASGRPLFVPGRIPEDGSGGPLVGPSDFYPPSSGHLSSSARPTSSAGGYPLLQQQVLRHISSRASHAGLDVAVSTDETEQYPPIQPITTAVVATPVASSISEAPSTPTMATTVQGDDRCCTISTQTPDELLGLYVMRLSAGLSAASSSNGNKKPKPLPDSARPSAPMEPMGAQPSGVLLRPLMPASHVSHSPLVERSWTVDNPGVSTTPQRRVSHPTSLDGVIPVPLGSNRSPTRVSSSTATRVNCPPIFAPRSHDQAPTGPFSERQINLYPPHRHWSDRTDEAIV